jgi:hypothetical protein
LPESWKVERAVMEVHWGGIELVSMLKPRKSACSFCSDHDDDERSWKVT